MERSNQIHLVLDLDSRWSDDRIPKDKRLYFGKSPLIIMKNELKEVETTLKQLSQIHEPGRWKPESYIGGGQSKFTFLNLKVPHLRKAQYSFSNKPIEKQWSIWSFIWNQTNCFEVALSAAHFVNSRPTEELCAQKDNLIQWQSRVDNWALSDELSNAYARILESQRQQMLPTFKKWNVSQDPWERRQSMVGLLFYSRFRKKALSSQQVLSFVKPHLHDDHYYVQKAVGWTLRECWNLYPEKTMVFLEKHAGDIPPGGWTAATEKLDPKEKAKLKRLRSK